MSLKPLFTSVDGVLLRVPSLDEGLAFYRDKLGHQLLWRSETAAGLALAESESELVISTELGPETDLLTESVDGAVDRFVAAGGTVLAAPKELSIGKVVVLRDPFGNDLVLLDSSKGRLTTDGQGNVTGVSKVSLRSKRLRPDSLSWLEQSYDAYPRLEDAFQAALDTSLNPRGPEMLYDLVTDLGMSPGATVVDVGCGEGAHTLKLAERFRFAVTGFDPVQRHIELGNVRLAAAAKQLPELSRRVRFELGTAEAVPVDDASIDLVWCRDVLVHVAALDRAYAEFRRILREGGHALIYQMFGTDRLEPREAEWLWKTMGVVPTSADPGRMDAAIAAAGLQVHECIDVATEWGEWTEEQAGKGSRQLLHASRLLRAPERYVAQFGQAAYDIMLGDCLWHVYAMIGKLSRRVYLLSRK
jgi:SAM-dependent methyltransferase